MDEPSTSCLTAERLASLERVGVIKSCFPDEPQHGSAQAVFQRAGEAALPSAASGDDGQHLSSL